MRGKSNLSILVCAFLLSACASGVKVGGGSDSPVSGSAGNAGSSGTVALRHCARPVATIAIETQQQPTVLVSYGLPPNPLPALRLIAQQSGCFRIVNRDIAMQTMKAERELAHSGELVKGSNFGGGQVVAADYVVQAELLVNQQNASGMGGAGALATFIPYVGGFIGAAAAGTHTSEAQVQLTLYNNRTSVQESVASGQASGTSFSLGGGFGGFGGGVAGLGGAGGYENTDQGKVVMGAMVDAFNHLVPQITALAH